MDFIDRLQRQLTEQLPGEEAHLKMAPYRRSVKVELDSAGMKPRLSAVMALIYLKENQWHLVLTKRNEYEGTHSAQVSFPGGRKEEGDASLIHTSIRETKEEIGVWVPDTQIIGSLTEVYIPPSNFLVNPVLSWLPEQPAFNPDPREVNYIIEFPVDELTRDDLIKETKIKLSTGLRLTVPYFDIKGEIVWGATAVILSEFREILMRVK